jgi:WD40 repeat protein
VAVADGREIARITHDGAVQAVAFSPNGKVLATASGEDIIGIGGEARLVAVADGHEIARITHDGMVQAVAFSPDGQFLATASGGDIIGGEARLVAVADGREIARITHDKAVAYVNELRPTLLTNVGSLWLQWPLTTDAARPSQPARPLGAVQKAARRPYRVANAPLMRPPLALPGCA